MHTQLRNETLSGDCKIDNKARSILDSNIKLSTTHGNSIPLFLGIAVVIAALIIAWRTVTGIWPEGLSGSGSTEVSANMTSESAGMSALAAETEKLTEKIADLNTRLKMLSDSATYLESKLIRAHVITDDILQTERTRTADATRDKAPAPESLGAHAQVPPPGAGPSDTRTAKESTSPHLATIALQSREPTPNNTAAGKEENISIHKSAGGMHNESIPLQSDDRAPAKQRLVEHETNGPWLINLVSLPSESDAERYMSRAQSRGITTQQQQVTVKGKKYWRIQITGFASAGDARTYAGPVKERLGLKEVWITKR